MKVIGLIQARMGSTRLPGKVMLKLVGKPVLWHIYNRLKNCNLLDLVVVSTGEYEKNREICEFASLNNIPFYSGSETDMIDRIYQTAKKFHANAIVRITADCPLIDPKIVDRLILEFRNKNSEIDIVANNKIQSFPQGLDAEIYSFEILEKMWKEIKEPEFREWFPLYIDKNPTLFRILNIKNSLDLSNFRWTIDYLEDYEFVKQVYESLYNKDRIFGMEEVLDLLKKRPELIKINKKYVGIRNVDAPKI